MLLYFEVKEMFFNIQLTNSLIELCTFNSLREMLMQLQGQTFPF